MWLEVWQGGDKTSTEFGVMEFEALSSEARCSEPDIRSGRGGLGGGILEFDEPGGLRMIVLMVQKSHSQHLGWLKTYKLCENHHP